MRALSSSAAKLVLSLCLLLFACSVPPDAQDLQRHLAVIVQMDWSGLHVDSVSVLNCTPADKDWQVDASYKMRLTADKDALPQEEQERIARYLSMCDSVLVHKSDHCSMRKSMVVTHTPYGWMPRELVASRPDLLPRIAEESKRLASEAAMK